MNPDDDLSYIELLGLGSDAVARALSGSHVPGHPAPADIERTVLDHQEQLNRLGSNWDSVHQWIKNRNQ